MTSKRTRSRKSNPRNHKHTLLSLRASARTVAEHAAGLAEAIDHDPLEIMGFASICAAGMQGDVEPFIDKFSETDPRLGPVVRAAIASMPMIDHLVKSELIEPAVLPRWLAHLDQTLVTGVLLSGAPARSNRITYLVEVTMAGGLVGTHVVQVQGKRERQITGFWTVAGPIGHAAEFYNERDGLTGDQIYRPVEIATGCQQLLMALDASMHARYPAKNVRAPWPLTVPQMLWLLEIAMGQLRDDEEHPYLALRRVASGRDARAAALRRSLSDPAAR